MDFVSPLIELINNVWGLARQPLGYICNLRDNVNSLRNANEELKAQSRDVKTRVEHEERGRDVQRTDEVARWLGDVQKFEGRVDQVLREAEERDGIRCLSRCLPQNCWSSYRLGKKVDQLLKEARDIPKKKGEFGDLTLPLSRSQVNEMPMDKTVGLDTSLDVVWKWLVDEKQGVIGLYGLGGVGKTTLMKKIKEKISRENPGFEVVIWVVVSKQVSKEAIQDAIRKKLDIGDETWNVWLPDEKVERLWQALTHKKFLLLIDDLWAWLDLLEIGVPNELQNGSKIVFTTRQKQICDQMGAEKTSFKVQCLTKEEALKLFEEKARLSTLKHREEIQELASQMAYECKELPLALITVGQAMAGIDNPREWEHELETLRRRPHGVQGMEEVYHVLEFSYNRLNDSTLQRCFLYCCLFPEDYRMRSHDLIGLWIGEGLLRGTQDVYSLRNEGESILGRLNRACLLESEHDDDDDDEAYVKMHDVVRDMAMWIARDHEQNEQKWLVIERQEDLMISNSGDTEKVSIWGERIVNINQIPLGRSQLKTLIVRETKVAFMPTGFFNLMAACLTVLDLSENEYIESFPEDVCTLINLEYLNLSGTCIHELPWDIDKLTRLRWFLLESMPRGILIPKGAITSLPLNVLSMWKSWWSVKEKEMVEKSKDKMEKEMVEELGRMENLADLSIEVWESLSVKEIFQSQNLQKSIRRVKMEMCFLKHIEITHSLWHLEILDLRNCSELVLMKVNDGIDLCFPNLSEVRIAKCGFSDLSWLVHAPKLRELTVEWCYAMKKIIGDGFAPEELTALRLFSRLKYVKLWYLPKLTSICDGALSFAREVRFDLFECPGLSKLPLDSSCARGGGFSIQADKDWWAKFEWDSAARVIFQFHRYWCPDHSQVEEMTYGEARPIVVADDVPLASQPRMLFLPDGPSE